MHTSQDTIMARGVNKVILVGNVGADPELKYTGSGTAVCNFSLATNESYKDREGNPVEKTEWHRLVAWDRLAEIVAEYVKKGRQLYVEGVLQTRKWEDQDGVTRYTTEIKVREMQMLGGGQGGDAEAPTGGSTARPRTTAGHERPKAATEGTTSGGDLTFTPDDDLPF